MIQMHRMANGGGHKRRITRRQREEILRLSESNMTAAQKLATKLKLSPTYVQRLRYDRGMA